MNILSSFSDFYSNLSSDGLFFFWIIIFLFLFLIFLSVILILKNKKLSKLLDENIDDNFLEEETSEIIQEEIKEQRGAQEKQASPTKNDPQISSEGRFSEDHSKNYSAFDSWQAQGQGQGHSCSACLASSSASSASISRMVRNCVS